MARSDFSWVVFDHAFTDAAPVATRTFQIEGTVVDAHPENSPTPTEGYVLVLANDVEIDQHRIQINGSNLPSMDLPQDGDQEWQTWMDRIPSGFLQSGDNRMTIERAGTDDDFFVTAVAVHWRECG